MNLFAPNFGLWATDLNGDVVDVFSGSPAAFKLAIPVATAGSPATMPVFITGTGTNSGQREYVVSQNVADTAPMTCNVSPTTAPTCVATPIELLATSPPIPLFQWASARYLEYRFLTCNACIFSIAATALSRVINTRNNTPDSCTPFQNQNGGLDHVPPWLFNFPAGSGLVTAEYNSATEQLVVANYDGGTISVIDVPLDEYGNDSNTYTNSNCTTYAVLRRCYGRIWHRYYDQGGRTPRRRTPASVTVLADGSKAYFRKSK